MKKIHPNCKNVQNKVHLEVESLQQPTCGTKIEYFNQNTQDRSAKGDVLPHACSRSCDRKKRVFLYFESFHLTWKLTTWKVNKLNTLEIANIYVQAMGACFNLNLLFCSNKMWEVQIVSNIWWSTFPLESMVEVARCLEKKWRSLPPWSCRDPEKQKGMPQDMTVQNTTTLPKINTHCPWK